MYFWYLIGIGFVCGVFSWMFFQILSSLPTQKRLFYPLLFALHAFSIGFVLRLAGDQRIADFGFYLTEVSFLFVYIAFAVAFLLGEKKYWKLK